MAEVADDDLAEPVDELHRDRLVEPELLPQQLDLRRVGGVAEHHLHRVAGNEPHQREHRDRHQQQGRNGHREASGEIP